MKYNLSEIMHKAWKLYRKAACAACVEQVKQQTGRHAFRPHAQPVNV